MEFWLLPKFVQILSQYNKEAKHQMSNTNWHGNGNPVYVDPPSSVARPIGWHETKRGRRPSTEDRLNARMRALGAAIENIGTETQPAAGLTSWVADPVEKRRYIRIDVSCVPVDGRPGLTNDFWLNSGLRIIERTLTGRELLANIDTGYSVYLGTREDRVSVTLFDIELAAAFGFFAAIRRRLRAADYPIDCGRFYFEVDGRETSHCAKRIAPAKFTLVAGLPLELETETQTEGGDYGHTKVYAS